MPPRDARGFTLLELLVAFIIAALALGVLFRGASGGLLAVGVANRYQEAISLARSRLATVGHGIALAPTHQQGDDGHGFHYELAIILAGSATAMRQPSDARNGPSPQLSLYAVQVSESWTDGERPRRVQLRTERIGRPS